MAERVEFPSTTGPTLAGRVDVPEGEVRGWGVFAHGFTLGKDSPAASRICKQLASEGIGMLRFDNLGLGDSEGDWGDGSFSHKVADTVRAVEFMNDSGREVRLLVGHSFGGSAVLAAAHDCPTVVAVASIGAPYDPGHVEHNYDALDRADRGRGRGAVPGRRQGARPSNAISSKTSATRISASRSAPCTARCWSCIRPPTTPSASPTPARSSAPRATPAASFRWKVPTTC